jgi:hypothetical protein
MHLAEKYIVLCTLHHLHPYHLQLLHEVLPNDLPRRQQFYQWFMENFRNNSAIVEKTFFSYESCFNGIL